MFNVVSDQLKVSQGWVRCGQCAGVFDASLHLQAERAPQTNLTAPLAASTEAFAADTNLPSAYLKPPKAPNSPLTTKRRRDTSQSPSPAQQVRTDQPLAPLEEVPVDVSFVRDAKRQAYWRKPLVRGLLAFFALLLIGLLALQMAMQQRDTLAVMAPRLKPVLQTMCDLLACRIGPVRQIEAIVIDSSSFNKVNDSVYRLSFSIKNTAANVVAMPSLEVTLTDTQDQAVIRRVLAPPQFGMTSGLLGVNAEFSGALSLQLTALETPSDTSNVSRRIAGYRLLAFYP